jgi:regulator of sigma E protease
MLDFLVKPLAFLLVLGVLIFVHELGHFILAKLMGVKVVRFSLGFGPRLLGFQRGETEYRIAALPLGGYVKMAGDDPTAEVAPEDRGRGFLEQPPWKRLLIAVAGPAMNLLLPLVLFVGLIWAQNGTQVPSAMVGTVVPGSPAEKAGLEPGDRIVSLGAPGEPDRPMRDFIDVQEFVVPRPDQDLVMTVERSGSVLPPITVHTRSDQDSNGIETTRRGIIGISPSYTPARVAPVAPGAAGPLQPFDLVVSVNGAPVANQLQLSRALAAASCRPVDLEVYREVPRKLPGAALADYTREHLAGVPSCADGKPSVRPVDQMAAAAIAAVEPGSPAERAGLRRGDVITAVGGRAVHTFPELVDAVSRELAGAKPGVLELADGRKVTLAAEEVVSVNEATGNRESTWTVGISGDRRSLVDDRALSVRTVPLQRGPIEVVGQAFHETGSQLRALVIGVGKMVSRQINPDRMGSIIMIYQETGKAVEQGWSYFILFVGFISVNLGLMNLLPIPVLDGGHIAQAVVETVTRRPLSIRAREIANMVGLILLISLMLFAFRNDVRRLWNASRPAAEESMR